MEQINRYKKLRDELLLILDQGTDRYPPKYLNQVSTLLNKVEQKIKRLNANRFKQGKYNV